MGRLVLVTGGARSGKSGWAERRLRGIGGTATYLATCPADESGMRQRVARHQAQRADLGWTTCEETLAVPEALRAAPEGPVLIDCLTLWLSNLLLEANRAGRPFEEDDAALRGRDLVAAVAARTQPVVVVTNEVGSGIVPMAELSRRFRDCAGRLNQTLGASADELVLLVCGQALWVKGG